MRAWLAGLSALAALAGVSAPARAKDDPVVTNWRATATRADRERLRNWREAWVGGLAQAKGADGGTMARDPALFEVDRALPNAMPPPGAYSCRTFKLGTRSGAAGGGFVQYPAFDCRVDADGGVVRLTKSGGSQRLVGQLYADGPVRVVFLGVLVLGDEANPRRYGTDVNRDMAGIVTRIGERRWRLALPAPRFESKLDLIEMVPAG